MTKDIKPTSIVTLSAEVATAKLKTLPSSFFYHNLKHTKQVVAAAESLIEDLGLNAQDRQILLVAAWFHDVGYTVNLDNHEAESIRIASEFLQELNIDEAILDGVKKCIEGTVIDAKPTEILPQILRDADSAHLGKKSMQNRSDLLRMEWEIICDKKMTDQEWNAMNIQFLEEHQYYTPIAKSKWGARKEKNLQQLKKNLIALDPTTQEEDKVDLKRSRGVETMFRVTLRNHINLSRIADNKANFLLSISGIILSLLLGELISDNKPVLSVIWPTLYFLLVCVVTMILAILATRPNVTKGKFSRDSLLNKKSNILFFGNFHAMPLDEFSWGVNELMKDDELLYDSLTKDLYYLGKVLHQKYAYLRIAFNFFMFGIISTALFYAIMIIT